MSWDTGEWDTDCSWKETSGIIEEAHKYNKDTTKGKGHLICQERLTAGIQWSHSAEQG